MIRPWRRCARDRGRRQDCANRLLSPLPRRERMMPLVAGGGYAERPYPRGAEARRGARRLPASPPLWVRPCT
jgi:hypothetical protein